MAIVDYLVCSIFIKVQITDSNTIYSPTATIYVKNANDQLNQYLIHYWPFNENYFDIISNLHLYNGINDALVTDRFGRPSIFIFYFIYF